MNAKVKYIDILIRLLWVLYLLLCIEYSKEEKKEQTFDVSCSFYVHNYCCCCVDKLQVAEALNLLIARQQGIQITNTCINAFCMALRAPICFIYISSFWTVLTLIFRWFRVIKCSFFYYYFCYRWISKWNKNYITLMLDAYL